MGCVAHSSEGTGAKADFLHLIFPGTTRGSRRKAPPRSPELVATCYWGKTCSRFWGRPSNGRWPSNPMLNLFSTPLFGRRVPSRAVRVTGTCCGWIRCPRPTTAVGHRAPRRRSGHRRKETPTGTRPLGRRKHGRRRRKRLPGVGQLRVAEKRGLDLSRPCIVDKDGAGMDRPCRRQGQHVVAFPVEPHEDRIAVGDPAPQLRRGLVQGADGLLVHDNFGLMPPSPGFQAAAW